MMKYLLKLILVLMITVLISCSSDDNTTNPTNSDIEIGGLFTLSGNLESLGKDSKAAMEIAIEDINKYLKESNIDVTVTGSYEDTELKPAVAKEKFDKLYKDGIRVFIGPSASSEVSAVKPLADSKNALVISHYSTAGSLALPGDNVFRFCPTDKIQAPAVLKLAKLDGKTHIVPLWREDAGNDGLVQSVIANKDLYSVNVSEGYKYSAETTDFSVVISRIKQQVEELLKTVPKDKICIYVASFDEIIHLFDQISENDILSEINWYGSDGIALNLQLLDDEKAAKFASKVHLSCPNLGLSESAKLIWQPLTSSIKQRTGNSTYNPYSVAVYDAVWVAVKAILNSGTSNIENLKNNFKYHASQHFGATGRALLDVNGDKAIGDYWFYEIEMIDNKLNWVKTAVYDGNTGVITKTF